MAGTIACLEGPACDFDEKAPELDEPEDGAPTGETCPECGKDLILRSGRKGPFLGCSGYPECTYTRNPDGEPQTRKTPAKPTDIVCDKCGKPMVIRTAPPGGGEFLGCSGYPRCRNAKPLEGAEAQATPATTAAPSSDESAPAPTTEETCPDCGAPLTVRSGRLGRFYGCSAYPKCKYTRNIPGESRPPKAAAEPTDVGVRPVRQAHGHPDQPPREVPRVLGLSEVQRTRSRCRTRNG